MDVLLGKKVEAAGRSVVTDAVKLLEVVWCGSSIRGMPAARSLYFDARDV